jgi:predicted nucleotidyltransferase
MDRDKFTPKLRRMLATIDAGRVPVKVLAFYVFGSYSRGALNPNDLDVILLYESPPPEARFNLRAYETLEISIRRALVKPGEKIELIATTGLSVWAQDDGEIIKTSDLVLLWSKEDHDWERKLAAIKPDPLAGRTPRNEIFPIKRLNTTREQMDYVLDDICQSRLILTRIAEADIECKLNEYHVERLAHLTKYVAKCLAKHLPFAFWWLEQHGHRSYKGRRGCEFWSEDHTQRIYLGRPRLGEMRACFADEPAIVRQCLIPYFKRGGPNELLVFERGPAFSIAEVGDTDD